jgi:hypothetical protein
LAALDPLTCNGCGVITNIKDAIDAGQKALGI